VRNRKPAPRRPVASVAPDLNPGSEPEAAADVEVDEVMDAASPPASAPASAPARRRTPPGAAGARRGPR
jgi:hypothetical protein